ncbi:hypothetical protein J6T66_05850 [bacterium]|nr:hypothetical protein [bacterium]
MFHVKSTSVDSDTLGNHSLRSTLKEPVEQTWRYLSRLHIHFDGDLKVPQLII